MNVQCVFGIFVLCFAPCLPQEFPKADGFMNLREFLLEVKNNNSATNKTYNEFLNKTDTDSLAGNFNKRTKVSTLITKANENSSVSENYDFEGQNAKFINVKKNTTELLLDGIKDLSVYHNAVVNADVNNLSISNITDNKINTDKYGKNKTVYDDDVLNNDSSIRQDNEGRINGLPENAKLKTTSGTNRLENSGASATNFHSFNKSIGLNSSKSKGSKQASQSFLNGQKIKLASGSVKLYAGSISSSYDDLHNETAASANDTTHTFSKLLFPTKELNNKGILVDKNASKYFDDRPTFNNQILTEQLHGMSNGTNNEHNMNVSDGITEADNRSSSAYFGDSSLENRKLPAETNTARKTHFNEPEFPRNGNLSVFDMKDVNYSTPPTTFSNRLYNGSSDDLRIQGNTEIVSSLYEEQETRNKPVIKTNVSVSSGNLLSGSQEKPKPESVVPANKTHITTDISVIKQKPGFRQPQTLAELLELVGADADYILSLFKQNITQNQNVSNKEDLTNSDTQGVLERGQGFIQSNEFEIPRLAKVVVSNNKVAPVQTLKNDFAPVQTLNNNTISQQSSESDRVIGSSTGSNTSPESLPIYGDGFINTGNIGIHKPTYTQLDVMQTVQNLGNNAPSVSDSTDGFINQSHSDLKTSVFGLNSTDGLITSSAADGNIFISGIKKNSSPHDLTPSNVYNTKGPSVADVTDSNAIERFVTGGIASPALTRNSVFQPWIQNGTPSSLSSWSTRIPFGSATNRFSGKANRGSLNQRLIGSRVRPQAIPFSPGIRLQNSRTQTNGLRGDSDILRSSSERGQGFSGSRSGSFDTGRIAFSRPGISRMASLPEGSGSMTRDIRPGLLGGRGNGMPIHSGSRVGLTRRLSFRDDFSRPAGFMAGGRSRPPSLGPGLRPSFPRRYITPTVGLFRGIRMPGPFYGTRIHYLPPPPPGMVDRRFFSTSVSPGIMPVTSGLVPYSYGPFS